MPVQVGARAGEWLRGGASLTEVIEYQGIPALARPVVESVFGSPSGHVEIVVGCRHGRRPLRDQISTFVDPGLSPRHDRAVGRSQSRWRIGG
ncbi:hypothetical protein [Mycobacterium riyadhense]|uniref:Uncharacterized protein n=1 Tax=Mycobacterium riyadhense TaxID=486698 RepID=A0A1X2BKB8_9MYCO|nr:hypothetical protein [Mycobacterium riyadhense]ORW64052.1 hypothetical protein AWC22_03195 [Mycobacterium riyadhense]VTO98879.1 hypothetical protein BIN_B_02760 [Mycobacterium riyadhense]